jgi:hypothetical protein
MIADVSGLLLGGLRARGQLPGCAQALETVDSLVEQRHGLELIAFEDAVDWSED